VTQALSRVLAALAGDAVAQRRTISYCGICACVTRPS